MIFVTVGTHEQQFNRVIKYIDELKGKGVIREDVIMQTGYCTYIPKYCAWKSMISYNDMVEYVKSARIVITHGGPASFIMPLQICKIPVVVPRQKEFNEHVNNHQIDFVKAVSERMGTIIPVLDINELGKLIINYDSTITSMNRNMVSNNKEFNKKLEKIVNEMF